MGVRQDRRIGLLSNWLAMALYRPGKGSSFPALCIAASLSFLGCGSSVVVDVRQPPTPPVGLVSVKFTVVPPDAEIYIDGQFMGTVDRYPDGWVAIEPSVRRLSLKRTGYYTWYSIREPGMNAAVFKATLVKKPKLSKNR